MPELATFRIELVGAEGIVAWESSPIKPSNAIFLVAPALLLLATRRRSLLTFAAGLAPALLTLAIWKFRGLGALAAAPAEPSRQGAEFFEKKIRPVLVERCYECHSAESKKLKGNFRLDSRQGLLKGGDSGPAIVPGAPEKSLLIKAVRYTDEDLQMPPKHQLTPSEVADLEAWVKMGAPVPQNAIPAANSALSYAIDFK